MDFLRGVAVLMVIGHHVVIRSPQAGVFRPIQRFFEVFGYSGVDLFFVLSGFLIGGLLFKEIRTYGRLDAQRFLIRRAFKIWPNYLAFLGFVVLYELYKNSWSIGLVAGRVWPNFVHVQNYLWSIRSHLWSLSVEEHFYLLLPLLLVLLIRRGSGAGSMPAIPWVAAAVSVGCLVVRFSHWGAPDHRTVYCATHFRIDSLFWGVFLSYLYHYHPGFAEAVRRYRWVAITAGLCLVAPMMFIRVEESFVWTIGFSLLYLGFGLILLGMLFVPMGRPSTRRWRVPTVGETVAFVGFYSYSVYLWHMDGARFRLERAVDHGFLVGVSPSLRWLVVEALYVVMAVVVGVIMAKLIELPALAVRDRLFPARSRISGLQTPEAKVVGNVPQLAGHVEGGTVSC